MKLNGPFSQLEQHQENKLTPDPSPQFCHSPSEILYHTVSESYTLQHSYKAFLEVDKFFDIDVCASNKDFRFFIVTYLESFLRWFRVYWQEDCFPTLYISNHKKLPSFLFKNPNFVEQN